MAYTSIGLLAIFILLIINADIFSKKTQISFPGLHHYIRLLISVILFHIADSFWGIFAERHLIIPVYITTYLFFLSMSFSIFQWGGFVIRYMQRKNKITSFVKYSSELLFAFQIGVIIVNFFKPLLFHLDENGEYCTGILRHLLLILQGIVFFITAIYSFLTMIKSKGSVKRRHFTIGFSASVMVLASTNQLAFPFLPINSVGYLLSGVILHTFLIEDEMLEQVKALTESLNREKIQKQELGEARHLCYTDPLTGVKNKLAFTEAEAAIESRIKESGNPKVASAVFDLNNLKQINDTMGHEAGDLSIMNASRLICNTFKHSPIYRIGGDEFTAILEGQDFENRFDLLAEFNRIVEENLKNGKVVVSIGIAEYEPNYDKSFKEVFKRADEKMYERKTILKHISV